VTGSSSTNGEAIAKLVSAIAASFQRSARGGAHSIGRHSRLPD